MEQYRVGMLKILQRLKLPQQQVLEEYTAAGV